MWYYDITIQKNDRTIFILMFGLKAFLSKICRFYRCFYLSAPYFFLCIILPLLAFTNRETCANLYLELLTQNRFIYMMKSRKRQS